MCVVWCANQTATTTRKTDVKINTHKTACMHRHVTQTHYIRALHKWLCICIGYTLAMNFHILCYPILSFILLTIIIVICSRCFFVVVVSFALFLFFVFPFFGHHKCMYVSAGVRTRSLYAIQMHKMSPMQFHKARNTFQHKLIRVDFVYLSLLVPYYAVYVYCIMSEIQSSTCLTIFYKISQKYEICL